MFDFLTKYIAPVSAAVAALCLVAIVSEIATSL